MVRKVVALKTEKIVSIRRIGPRQMYDILDVKNNNNYIANGFVVHNSASDWARSANRELKKKLAQIRTKHLLYVLCFPLKVTKLEKTYLDSFTNYWIDLFARGTGAIYIKDRNPLMDSWRVSDFKDVGAYTEFTNVQKVKEALKKHPNFWQIIRFPKASDALYNKYLTVREHNVYDEESVFANVTKTDIYMALMVLTLRDIMSNDVSLTMKRIILHMRNSYDLDVPKPELQLIVDDCEQLIKKVREQAPASYEVKKDVKLDGD